MGMFSIKCPKTGRIVCHCRRCRKTGPEKVKPFLDCLHKKLDELMFNFSSRPIDPSHCADLTGISSGSSHFQQKRPHKMRFTYCAVVIISSKSSLPPFLLFFFLKKLCELFRASIWVFQRVRNPNLMGLQSTLFCKKNNLKFRCNKSQITDLKKILSEHLLNFSYIVLKISTS